MSFWDKAVDVVMTALMGKDEPPAAAPSRARAYRLGLVGERNYQAAIKRCREGEVVTLVHEPDNPYDDLAIAAVCPRGRVLGYVARDAWLREAVHDDGKACTATIASIASAEKGLRGVVLEVTLCKGPIQRRDFVSA